MSEPIETPFAGLVSIGRGDSKIIEQGLSELEHLSGRTEVVPPCLARLDWLQQSASASSMPPQGAAMESVDVERRFCSLTDRWRQETGFSSSTAQIAMSEAYQQIIGLGPPAIRLILQELRRSPDHWFWALRALTGEDPVSAEDRGNLARMTQAWLEWATSHGY